MSNFNVSHVPLVYPYIANSNNFTNIVLIDNTVPNYQLFVNSVNSSTFPIVYSYNSSKNELLKFLQTNFINISRIAMIFHSDGPMPKMFLDNKPLFLNNEVIPYSENVEFIINIIKQFQIKNIDYLACSTLNFSNWLSYYDILKNETNVIVGASKDETGNINYGGDWVMESTSEDIEIVYFTQSIEYYNYLLGGTVGYTTIIIKKNNTIYGTGYNDYGQLGDGTNTSYNTLKPMLINSLPAGVKPVEVSCGVFHTIVLMSDGTIYGCGDNSYGQLGDGTNTPYNTLQPMLMNSVPTGVKPVAISCGERYTIVLMSNGTIYGTGNNSNGQLGNGTSNNSYNTLQLMLMNSVPAGVKPVAVSCGASHTIVLMSDGTIYGTGLNDSGQLGIGYFSSPKINLTLMTLPSDKTPVAVSCGIYHTIVLMSDGTVYGTGRNSQGQLGNGTFDFAFKNLQVMSSVPSNKTPISVSCGGYHTIVLMSDGTVYGTGYNGDGQLGNGTNTSYNTLQLMNSVPSDKNPVAISCGNYHTIILMSDGTLYGTGYNRDGELANGTNTYSYNTLQVMTEDNGITPATNIEKLMSPSYVAISNICFPSGTPIMVDQGIIPIEKINCHSNTIYGEKIVAITKTITNDKYLVCFEKDSLEKNVPNKKTIISKNHKIFYKGKVFEAYQFIGKYDNVYRIKYRGELLYNVLMEKHESIIVNNLICETLDPQNIVARLYNGNYTQSELNIIIMKMNDCVRKNDREKFLQIANGLKK